MMPARVPLFDRPEWQAISKEKDASRIAALYQKIASSLDTSDIEDLNTLLETGTEADKLRAMRLLLAAARSGSQAMQAEQKRRTRDQLLRFARTYPAELGVTAFYLLQKLDPAEAEEFLASFQSESASEAALLTYIPNLSLFPQSVKLMEILRQLAARTDSVGKRAQLQLENLGLLTESQLRSLAEDWQRTKSRGALNKLYFGYISHQGGKPLSPILDLLGAPTRQDGSRYFYDSLDGVTLYLEADPNSRLKAMNIK